MTEEHRYWRRDQSAGITPPNLANRVEFADHIVKARGKRTQYTSVSTSDTRIGSFGPQLYELLRDKLSSDSHALTEHAALMTALRERARTGEKADRLKAAQAMRYAQKNSEGLIDWRLDFARIEPKHLYLWTAEQVRPYFVRR